MIQNIKLKLGFGLLTVSSIAVIVFDFKKEPLGVPLGVSIVLQDQVVLSMGHLDRSGQVPTLKLRVEL